MYFGDPVDAGFQPYVSMAPPSKELQWKQTLTETKRLDTRPKYPKRCKEKYQKNLFRLSFKPDLAICGRLTKIGSTHLRQWFSTTRLVEMFFLDYRARNASRVNMGLWSSPNLYAPLHYRVKVCKVEPVQLPVMLPQRLRKDSSLRYARQVAQSCL